MAEKPENLTLSNVEDALEDLILEPGYELDDLKKLRQILLEALQLCDGAIEVYGEPLPYLDDLDDPNL